MLTWLWPVIVGTVVLLIAHRLSRPPELPKKRQAAHVVPEPVYTTLYPVFTKRQIHSQNARGVAASKDAARSQGELLGSRAFREATAHRQFSDDVSQRMLVACEAMAFAEEQWFRHAVMMDANISVVSGRSTRDDALATAMKRLEAAPATGFRSDADAKRMRDEWKTRLEDPNAPVGDPTARPYTNPWSAHVSQHFWHWTRHLAEPADR